VPSRNAALTIIVVVDSPHGENGTHGGSVAAPIWKRIAEPALQHLGVAPDVDPADPVLVARGDDDDDVPIETTSVADVGQPTVSLVVDGAPGQVPDVTGMSARDAIRQLMKGGLNARLSGDGVVASQDPPAGTPLEPGMVCRLVLDRSAGRRLPPAGSGHP